jgi:glutamine amidotransferase
LFGFRSVIPSMVHRSLVAADNALCTQSQRHPDGWGVAYYVDGAPHVMKSASTALDDHLFHRLSGIVSSNTVVAHVRKATVGANSVLNSHPFQHGRWVLAHNGTIAGFDEVRPSLIREIAPHLRGFILGDTDSEVVFFLLLTMLQKTRPLSNQFGVEEVMEAMKHAVARIREVCDGRGGATSAILTLLVTDGTTLVATRNGRDLYYSTYKTRCADRDTCSSFAPECEAPSTTGFVNHFILSSEPLGGENIWLEVPEGQVVGVDWRMKVQNRPLTGASLPIVAA